jgi:hypothetical protein
LKIKERLKSVGKGKVGAEVLLESSGIELGFCRLLVIERDTLRSSHNQCSHFRLSRLCVDSSHGT